MTTYEMWWDCASCGSTGLLGKTHRCCPNCGAPQDAAKRYFPPPGQAVRANGHVFVGVDWKCASCETPNSRAAKFCVNCGMPQDDNADVARRPDRVVKGGRVVERAPAGARLRRRWSSTTRGKRRAVTALAVLAVVVVLGLITAFWQRDVTVRVTEHRWTRTVNVDRMAPRSEGAWCDSMASDGYSVSRSREVRSTNHIPDGEECHEVQSDNGDGTYTSRTECSTRYRDEPVYDDYCRYTVDRWGFDHAEVASGRGTQPPPYWPSVSVSGGSHIGATREGGRREELELVVADTASSSTHVCEVDAARWSRLEDDGVYPMRVRVITGGAVCGTLGVAKPAAVDATVDADVDVDGAR